jgi:hypothetical protein
LNKNQNQKTNFKFKQNLYKNSKSGKIAKTNETLPDRRTKNWEKINTEVKKIDLVRTGTSNGSDPLREIRVRDAFRHNGEQSGRSYTPTGVERRGRR